MTDIGVAGSIRRQENDGIVVLTIDNPDRNLLNPPVMTELRDDLARASGEARGVIITGADGVFCAGLDVPAIQAGGDPVQFAEALVALLKVFPGLGCPVVAAVNGDALASGASIVAACDYAVAVPTCRVGTFEVSIGIWPMIAQVPLIQRIGARAAIENIGSGNPFTAQRSHEVGLVQAIAPAESLIAESRAWIESAARAGKVGRVGRPSVYTIAELPYEEALDWSLAKFVSMFEESK